MNANEREWEALTTLWRASVEDIDRMPVRRLIAAERRRLAAVVAGEILTLAFFAWLTWWFVRDGVRAWEAVWISTLWTFAAVAVPLAAHNRRGAWRSMAETVVEFRRQRAARRMGTIRIATRLFVAEVIVVLAELAWFDRLTPAVGASLAVMTAGFIGWTLWMRRRAAGDVAASEE